MMPAMQYPMQPQQYGYGYVHRQCTLLHADANSTTTAWCCGPSIKHAAPGSTAGNGAGLSAPPGMP